MIKLARLNKVKQYEIMVHGQNHLRSFYMYGGKMMTLYDVVLAPEYFQVVMVGGYVQKSLDELGFLKQCKEVVEKSEGYANSTIKAVEMFNSSSITEPMKVVIYSENATSIVKSTL